LSVVSVLLFIVLAFVGYAAAGTGLFLPVFVLLILDFAVMVYAVSASGEPHRG